jgi:[ribosomal protein S18]-alanine N-acetyltransferase
VRLRPLVAADLDRVLELEVVLFGPGAWSRAGYEAELVAPGRRYVAAEVDGVLAGYAGGLIAPDESHVMTVGVDPAHRRRGIGSALVGDLVQAARSAGSGSMILEVRADHDGPQRLYRSFGFVTIGRRPGYYQLEGADAVVMRLDLTSTPG